MKKIYVTPNFIQKDGDSIIATYPSYVEIEVNNESDYSDFVYNISDNDAYTMKLSHCIQMRVAEYSKLNQLAMQFDDSVNGTTTLVDAIKEIKAKYPKPTME